MKIDSSHTLARPNQSESSDKAGKANSAAPAAKGNSPAVVTHLNQSAKNAGQDIDQARVEEIRQAISEGRLEISAERIADGLIDSVRDLLGQETRGKD
ncbi:flagellar biosynthesis anti-sigma factor FlgM [Litchfieldella xinjiangensis]|uniref:flagellar biosynthesis anti-sigma factor FlgM n=1 Tax=Litchfieldella xinjiangensis TaxID=1166948 RepID=UPI0005B9F923|nr:flagellar biosynthesis anti-sigma factor FlgM [Halomonas xinjiangensis]